MALPGGWYKLSAERKIELLAEVVFADGPQRQVIEIQPPKEKSSAPRKTRATKTATKE